MSSKVALLNEKLALRVREAMQRNNVGEDHLSEETHIPRPRLRRILAAKCDSTTFFEIVALAAAFGQSLDSFVS